MKYFLFHGLTVFRVEKTDSSRFIGKDDILMVELIGYTNEGVDGIDHLCKPYRYFKSGHPKSDELIVINSSEFGEDNYIGCYYDLDSLNLAYELEKVKNL